MAAKFAKKDTGRSGSHENIAFIRQMLAELRRVAEKENADIND
ncbi:hypothetical protein PMI09_01160 [Rhizobium sp. CF122]|jgi:hypothetical protein|nr:hypothetical protein [Rhizobium sp. CF122]EJL57438.1 hypothetical protein PMI09_01160 [Rhizobium sp. CF122]